MKVVGKNIMIKETEVKIKTKANGLILGEKQREDLRYREGIIILPGSEVNVVKKEDKIYFDKHAGFNLEIDEENYIIIQEKDIVVVL